MATKKGLGIARDSIFKKTEKKETRPDNIKETPKTDDWVKLGLQCKTSHKKMIDDIAFIEKKEKRDVLAEIFEYYRQKKNPVQW
tara:strand:+ start:359 stop:610 length:252 start_codon:yes stop_codon:yes gene_type:complete